MPYKTSLVGMNYCDSALAKRRFSEASARHYMFFTASVAVMAGAQNVWNSDTAVHNGDTVLC